MSTFLQFLCAALLSVSALSASADTTDNDHRISVTQTWKLVSVDKTVQILQKKDGQIKPWTIQYDDGQVELGLDSNGYSSFVFNNFSMCMFQDLGELAAPYKFATIDPSGKSREFVIPASTPAKPVHVSGICPKPGQISVLSLSSEQPTIFPDDLQQTLAGQLQARTQDIVQNQKFIAAAKQNGLGDYYAYIQPGKVCLTDNDGTKNCDYQLVVLMNWTEKDYDGFLTPEVQVGVIDSATLKEYDDAYNDPKKHLTIAVNLRLEAEQSAPTNTAKFNADGSIDIPYGSGDSYSAKTYIAPTSDCVLRVTLNNGRANVENVRNANCKAQLPDGALIPASFPMNID